MGYSPPKYAKIVDFWPKCMDYSPTKYAKIVDF